MFQKLTVKRAKIQQKEKTQPPITIEVRKLFIGGIPPTTTFDEFQNYFIQFGELSDILLPKKCEGSHLNAGFGFVTYTNSKNALSVLNYQKTHTLRAKWVI